MTPHPPHELVIGQLNIQLYRRDHELNARTDVNGKVVLVQKGYTPARVNIRYEDIDAVIAALQASKARLENITP